MPLRERPARAALKILLKRGDLGWVGFLALIESRRSEKMTVGKGVTGTALQVVLELLGTLQSLKGGVELHLPGNELRRVRTMAAIVVRKALP
jgi:hypothetical protein